MYQNKLSLTFPLLYIEKPADTRACLPWRFPPWTYPQQLHVSHPQWYPWPTLAHWISLFQSLVLHTFPRRVAQFWGQWSWQREARTPTSQQTLHASSIQSCVASHRNSWRDHHVVKLVSVWSMHRSDCGVLTVLFGQARLCISCKFWYH